ncbi:hypothetical protein [Nocardioides sp. GCM10030258]|uniref:hypothetical protein n=1 Tax=unclassified Nocardioides TaxID=2615069 RepID=UPI00360E6AB3
MRSAISRLQEAPARVRAVRQEHEAQDVELRNNPQLSDTYRRQLRKELHEVTIATPDQVDMDLKRIQTTLTSPAPADTRPSVDQLLDEQRQAKAWGRAERLLGAGTSPLEVVKDAEQATDLATLRALRTELPTWIVATTHGGATHEERVSAATSAKRLVDLALARTLPEGIERAALRGRLQWETHAPMVGVEMEHARRLLEGKTADGLGVAISLRYMSADAQALDTLTV